MISSSSEEYQLYQPQNGWAEQSPIDWYYAALKTLKDVISKSDAEKSIFLFQYIHYKANMSLC